MAYIPKDAEWYLATLVMEIIVRGSRHNVVHSDVYLLKAKSPEQAYAKAIRTGKGSETTYINPKGQRVEHHFRGISNLNVVYEPLEDGSELWFKEAVGVSESEIRKMIPRKKKLSVFVPLHPFRNYDPDYRSAEVVEMALKMIKRKRKRN